jgi:hypothetical protein
MTDDAPASAASASHAPRIPTKAPTDIGQSGDFYMLVGILVGVLFAGAIAIWLLDRWRKHNDCDDSPSLSLTNYRAMFEAGEITQAEYDKILARMAPKIKGDAKAAPIVTPLVPPPPPQPKSE